MKWWQSITRHWQDFREVKILRHQVEQLKREQELWLQRNLIDDINAIHILDRSLDYLATRIEVENLTWLRWIDLESLFAMDLDEAQVQWEIHHGLESPRLRSLKPVDLNEVLKAARSELGWDGLRQLLKDGFMVQPKAIYMNLWLPVLFQGEVLGVIWFQGLPSDHWPYVMDPLRQGVGHLARNIQFGLRYWDACQMAMQDDLTQLSNQRHLLPVLRSEMARAQRHKRPFTVLFMDLDHFKSINDSRGHWVGSRLLTEVGKIVQASIRNCDFGFRYGGDEFVVLLPDTPLAHGQIVAERLRKNIEEARFVMNGNDIKLTVSVGVASFPEQAKTAEAMIHLADQAMYKAKQHSRNCVYLASA